MNRKNSFPISSLRPVLFLSFIITLETTAANQNNLPDLDVLFISRNPKYFTYQVFYPSGIPTLQSGTENDKHWPDIGETVVFTAHVMNKGENSSGYFTYTWKIDDTEVETGTLSGLLKGERATTSIQWQWEGWEHTVEFIVDPENAINEFCENNNSIKDRTDALDCWIYFKDYRYDQFEAYPSIKGSYSAEDWVQSNIDTLNQMFCDAIYALTPNGILERVRVDSIFKYPEGSDPYIPERRKLIDGEWQLDHEPDAHYLQNVDYGFLHELCHQFGRIDIYVVGISSWCNRVISQSGNLIRAGVDPIPVKHGLMFDMFPYFSEHTAFSFKRDLHKRRGYYGEYLFDIPKENKLKICNQQGESISDVRVRVYRKCKNRWEIPNEIAAEGYTDENGLFSIGAEPFGNYIDVVGVNGLLFFVLSTQGVEHYNWLTILQTNLAYWSGDSLDATYTLKTTLPVKNADPAPANLRIKTQQHDRATLQWDPAQGEGISYYIYSAKRMATDFSVRLPFVMCDSTQQDTVQV